MGPWQHGLACLKVCQLVHAGARFAHHGYDIDCTAVPQKSKTTSQQACASASELRSMARMPVVAHGDDVHGSLNVKAADGECTTKHHAYEGFDAVSTALQCFSPSPATHRSRLLARHEAHACVWRVHGCSACCCARGGTGSSLSVQEARRVVSRRAQQNNVRDALLFEFWLDGHIRRDLDYYEHWPVQ